MLREMNEDERINLILLNSMLMIPSPIWGKHDELVAETKKDSTSTRSVS